MRCRIDDVSDKPNRTLGAPLPLSPACVPASAMQDDRSDRSSKSKSKGTKPPSASSTPRQLSSLDADVQQIHLFAAVRAEKLETIKKLVPPASLQTHELSTGETPLHVAVDTGHAKVRATPRRRSACALHARGSPRSVARARRSSSCS